MTLVCQVVGRRDLSEVWLAKAKQSFVRNVCLLADLSIRYWGRLRTETAPQDHERIVQRM